MSTTPFTKTALITGGARRLGREIALTLADAGWNIALHYHQSESEAKEAAQLLAERNIRYCLVQADLSDEGQVRRAFGKAVLQLGRVDAVVNNAARFDFDDANTFSTANLLDHVLPNLAAPIVLTQELARHLEQGSPEARGVVVNLLDQKLSNLNPDFFSYTLSKAALQTATTMLAQALAPRLRVVGVAPGLTLPSHMQTPEAFEKTHRLAPLGKASSPEDIAQAVLFLLNSPSITGTTLMVDGGQHLMGMERDFSLMDV